MPTSGIRNLIREGKNHQIYSAMQTGSKFGMQTMDAALVDLLRRGVVSREEAEKRSNDPEEMNRLMGGASGGAASPGNGSGAGGGSAGSSMGGRRGGLFGTGR